MKKLQTIKNLLRYTIEPTSIEFRSTRKALVRARSFLTKGSFLDIGCGNKPYQDLFASLSTRYIGMDYPDAVYDNKFIDFVGSGLHAPVKSGSFDTLLSIQVLEHVPDPGTLISESARILKTGGVLVITAPFIYSLHSQPHDYFRYTTYGLQQLLKTHFEIIDLSKKAKFFASLIQMLILHFWNPVKRIKNPLAYIAIGMPTLLVTNILQIIALFLDLFGDDETFTSGYCIVARKKAAQSEAKT